MPFFKNDVDGATNDRGPVLEGLKEPARASTNRNNMQDSPSGRLAEAVALADHAVAIAMKTATLETQTDSKVPSLRWTDPSSGSPQL